MSTIITSEFAPRTALLISLAPVILQSALMSDANDMLAAGATDEQVHDDLATAIASFEG